MAKKQAQAEFTRLHSELMDILSKKPSGMYGCTSLDDIEEIYVKSSAFEQIAQEHGFTNDPRCKEVIDCIRKRQRSDYATLNELLEKAKEMRSTNLDEMIYNIGAIIHCWGPDLTDQRFSKAQIGDGTYQGYLEKNPERMGDGTYARHFEQGFLKK